MTVEELVARIKSSGNRNYVYHFTNRNNFATIRSHGLLSKRKQEELGIAALRPGGDAQSQQTDKKRGIYNDVSLSLTNNHPMGYICRNDGRQPNQVVLSIDPEILFIEGVRVALGLAHSDATRILPISQAIDEIDLQILYDSDRFPSNEFKKRIAIAEKIEVLVPNEVPKRFFDIV